MPESTATNSNTIDTKNDETKIRTKAIRNLLIKSILPALTKIAQQPYQKPSCFVCYAWGVPEQEKLIQKDLAEHLKLAGVDVKLDMWHNKGGTWISEHTQRIATSDAVIVSCSQKLRQKYDDPNSDSVVSLELEQVFARLKKEKHKATVLPILLDGTEDIAKPSYLFGVVHFDFTDKLQYTLQLLGLLERIYAIKDAQAAAAIQVIQKRHNELVKQITKGKMEVQLAPFIAEEKRLMQTRKDFKQAALLNQLSGIYQLSSAVQTNSIQPMISNNNNNDPVQTHTTIEKKKTLTQQLTTNPIFYCRQLSWERLNNLPPSTKYVQHRQALTELNNRWAKQAHQNIAMIALCGISGSGKSELAKTFAYTYAKTLISLQEPPIIWWLGAETSQTLQNNYLMLAAKLDIIVTQPEGLKSDTALWTKFIQEVHSKATSRPDWLLIYDNVEQPSVLENYFSHFSGTTQGRILVTTQYANFFTSTEHNLSLDAGLTPEEAINLLSKLSGLSDTKNATLLAKTLGHLPMALTAAALAIHNSLQHYEQLNFSDYLIQHNGLHSTVERYQQPIFNSLSLIFNKLPVSSLSLLQALAYLPSDGVPYYVLNTYLKNLINEPDDTVNQQLKSSLHNLKFYSLLNEEHTNEIEKIHFNVHRIVQTAMQWRLQNENTQRETVALTLLKTLNQLYPDLSETNIAENLAQTHILDPIAEHVLTLLSHSMEKNRTWQELHLSLVVKRAIAIRKWGDAKKALEFAENAKHIAKEFNLKEQEANALWEIRAAYCALEQEKEASSYDEEVLASYKSVLGENHPKIAWCLCQIGIDYDNFNQPLKSLNYKQQALALYKSLYGENHSDVARCLTEIGNSLDVLNQGEEALTHYQSAITLYKSLYGDKNSNVAWCMLEMGVCYNGLKKYQEALNAIRQAHSIYISLYDDNHLSVAWCLTQIGNSHDGLRQFQQGFDTKSQALRIYKTLYGDNHPKVAWCLLLIANSFNALKQYKKSLNTKKQALAIYKALYGDNHLEIARCLEDIGNDHDNLHQIDEAQVCQQKAFTIYQNLYGDNHLDVARCMVIIGNYYDRLNQPEKGLDIKQHALTIYKDLHKDLHPDVAWCLSYIGSSYDVLKEPKTGLQFKQQALKIYQACDCNLCKRGSALCFEMIGNSWEALKQSQKSLKSKQKSLTQYKALPNDNSNDLDIAWCLISIAESHNTLKNYGISLDVNKQALSIFKALYDDSHPNVALCLDRIGQNYLFLNQPKNALLHLKQALSIYKIFLGEKDMSVAYTLTHIGGCHCLLNQLQEAKKVYRQALSIFSALNLERDDPVVAQIQKDLEMLEMVELEPQPDTCRLM